MIAPGADPFTGTPGEAPYLRLPRAAVVFERRAARLEALAQGHAAADWLATLARLCQAQRIAAHAVPASLAGRDLPPSLPLRASEWRRGAEWRAALAVILDQMRAAPLPAPARRAAGRLEGADPDELEALADALLGGSGAPPDAAMTPFLAAGLQVYWTSLAEQLAPDLVERSSPGCPVCGSPPVAGVVHGDDKVRYLCCSLCATEWHLLRVQCASCRSTAAVSYFAIEGDAGGVKAEACDACGTYLKIFYRERSPSADAFADDAATLALDLLMAEQGYSRGGVNAFVAISTGE